jgi:hypothetical protein
MEHVRHACVSGFASAARLSFGLRRLETIMTFDEIDPGLYGAWGEGGYCGRALPPPAGQAPVRPIRHAARDLARELTLEIKSAEVFADGAGLRSLLNEATEELKEQLRLFQRLRIEAARMLDAPDGDQKLARADLKAATDAIALIVRTLDKTDELQRKIDDAGEAERARHVDDDTLANLCESLNRHIADRAEQLARDLAAHEPGGVATQDRPPDDAPG